jgi:hypothetical protein
MRNLFFIVLIVAALLIGGYFAHKMIQAHRDYAPPGSEDNELAVQPAPEPAPPLQPSPAQSKSTGPMATLPASPIPYDQLKKEGDPATTGATPSGEPPKNNSNEKAIFY